MARSNPSGAATGGFTLVELLVVVAIMVLVASMAVISVGPMLRGRALRSAAGSVQALLYQARTYAATHNTYAALCIGVPDGPMELYAYVDFVQDVGDPSKRLLVEGTKTQTYLPTGARFADNPPVQGGSGARNTVAFAPTGSLDATQMGMANRFIRVTDVRGESTKRIEIVFASGMAQIRDE